VGTYQVPESQDNHSFPTHHLLSRLSDGDDYVGEYLGYTVTHIISQFSISVQLVKTMDEEEAKHLGSQGTLDAQAITSSSCYLITLSGELCG